jgi:molecular chaperone GrpE
MSDENDDLQEKLEAAAKEAEQRDNAANQSLSEIDEVKAQLTEMTETAKRTMADMQNLKRRQEEERKLLISMANIDLIRSILPVLDNIDRAIEHVPEGIDDWFKGLEISLKQIHKILEERGLTPMETLEQDFNPDLHQAVAQGPGEKDKVIAELEKGYKIGDRVIRHAKVQVGDGTK